MVICIIPGRINISLDDTLKGIKFGQDSEGNWGYITPGADSVNPFSKSGSIIDNKILLGSISNKGTVSATSVSNYNTLTASNFILEITSVIYSYSARVGSANNNSVRRDGISQGTLLSSSPKISYASDTGIVTVTLPYGSGSSSGGDAYGSTSWSASMKANVYCYY